VLNSVKSPRVSKGRKKVSNAKRQGHRVFLGVWVPEPVAAAVAGAGLRLGLPRSEFLRSALAEKLRMEGIMEGNTDQFTRVLLLWLELHSAVAQARPRPGSASGTEPRPWASEDPNVRELWRKLTDPRNLLALEQWLCQSAEGRPAEWARQALRACRERSRGGNPAS
jgi:hypothetical protein